MPEQFHQYTTYEQSLELKELGVSQTLEQGDRAYFVMKVDRSDPRAWLIPEYKRDRIVAFYETRPGYEARAFTFQEMFYELAQHYGVTLSKVFGAVVLFDLWADIERSDEEEQPVFHVALRTGDPFPAVYAAFKWHLQQQSLTKKP